MGLQLTWKQLHPQAPAFPMPPPITYKPPAKVRLHRLPVPAPHAQCRRAWQHPRNAGTPLVYCVTLWAQDDEAQFIGPKAALVRNGAPIAARVAPFLQLASLAGVHVGRLNVVLVGCCPVSLALPIVAAVLPQVPVWYSHDCASADTVVTYWCHLCAAA
jgi:hypothetical protein